VISTILEVLLSIMSVNTMTDSVSSAAAVRFTDTAHSLEAEAQEKPYGSGTFGQWVIDADSFPAYEYTLDQRQDPRALYETTRGASNDHWHLLGNDRITATAHNGGHVIFYDWSRGGKALSRWRPESNHYGGGFKFIESDGAVWNTLWDSLPGDTAQRRVFGTGYFEKTTWRSGLAVTERITAPSGDDPVLLSETRLQNDSGVSKTVTVVEYWDVDLYQITLAPIVGGPFLWIRDWLNVLYRIEPVWNADAGVLQAQFKYVLGPLRPDKAAPSLFDFYPKTVFLAALDPLPAGYSGYAVDAAPFFGDAGINNPPGVTGSADGRLFRSRSASSGKTMLAFRRTVRLAAGEEVVFRYLYGYAEGDSIPALVKRYQAAPDGTDRATVEFESPEAPYLGRELAWHAYYLQAGSIYSDFYDAHVVDQGSAYAYEQGLSGSTRDFALFALPLVYIRPDLAKESLRFMMRSQYANGGKLPYALAGYGVQTGLALHAASSDLDLFLLWALAEYLGATQDFDFLQEEQPWYRSPGDGAAPVLQHARAAFRHLSEQVGRGPHGLVRSGTGDWNDGLPALSGRPLLSLMRGESAQNAGLAAFVLPVLAGMVGEDAPSFARELRGYGDGQARALQPLWNGKWMARGYSGWGGEYLGGNRLFLDAQAFGVLGNAWTPEQVGGIFGSIEALCVRPQQAGAVCIAPITDNIADPGTTWAVVDAWVVHAWAQSDPRKAWDFFLKTTMAARAEAYPDLWYGIWSGPDAFGADASATPGQAFTGALTPTCNFPVMNMNRHAGVLFDAVKLAGIEPRGNTIVIDPQIPLDRFALRLPLVGVAYTPTTHTGYYKPVVQGTFHFAVRCPSGLDPHEAAVFANGNPVAAALSPDGFLLFDLAGQPGLPLEWEIRQAVSSDVAS